MPKYKFSDKLMFAIVMQDEALCREFIERVFHGRKVEKLIFPNDIHITPGKDNRHRADFKVRTA